MYRHTPGANRTDTVLPYTRFCRSGGDPSLPAIATAAHRRKRVLLHAPALKARAQARRHRAALDRIIDRRGARHVDRGADVADRPLAGDVADEIGRAHV